MDDNWQDNPKLAGIAKNKLDMLQQMARQGAGKSPSDLLPFIMNAASQGRNAGLNFNSNEINTIIEVLKMGKSPRERAKLDKVVNLMKMMKAFSAIKKTYSSTSPIMHSRSSTSALATAC